MGTKKTTVFIDGGAGTTGLRIHERLATRDDIELLTISEEQRKDPSARLEMLIRSDVTFLCLPDDAAKEAVMPTLLSSTRRQRTVPSKAGHTASRIFPENSKQWSEHRNASPFPAATQADLSLLYILL